jgi:Sulfotransferase family
LNDRRPILILGVSRRSGTNFLSAVLSCHRDCAPPQPVWENFLLEHADLLGAYAKRTAAYWLASWGDIEPLRAALARSVAHGALEFLQSLAGDKRVVAKTPSVQNLHLAPELFTGAQLLLLVRDGRSVTESYVRGFGWSHERAMRTWARGADTILAFTGQPPSETAGVEHRLVRYEDLVEDFDGEVTTLLEFLRLDRDRFDYSAASGLPVLGSSFASEEHDGSLDWRVVEKTGDFDPVRRFAHWDRRLHERFEWLAGDQLERLGYQRVVSGDASRTSAYRNRALDAAWPVRVTVERARGRARRHAMWPRKKIRPNP